MHKLFKAGHVDISQPTIISCFPGLANYSNQHVAGGPVLQGGEGHGAPAVLVSQLPTPQVGLWECYPPLLGRVVLGGDREQLLLPGLLVKAGSSWGLHWDQ